MPPIVVAAGCALLLGAFLALQVLIRRIGLARIAGLERNVEINVVDSSHGKEASCAARRCMNTWNTFSIALY